jgi:hypothetical protein
MSAAPLLLLGLFLLAKKSTTTTAPAPLPKPLGKPPATVTPITAAPSYVVPGSPPAGGAVPGSPPNGGAVPGSPPKGAQKPGATPYAETPTPNSTPAKQQGMVTAPFVSMPAAKPYVAPKKTTAKKPAAKKPAAKKPAASPAGTVKAAPVLESHNRGSTPAGYDPVKARSRARALAAYLAKKGPAGYSHDELKSWQVQAAITPDGKYGGSARGALIFYGVKDPPRPFFAPVATLPYIPPEKR